MRSSQEIVIDGVEQSIVALFPDLYSLTCTYNTNQNNALTAQANTVISIILDPNQNIFSRYVSNIDQLRIFLSMFKQYEELIVNYLISDLNIFSGIINDVDAFIHSLRIVTLAKNREKIVNGLMLIPHLFKMVIDSDDALTLAEKYSGSMKLRAAFAIHSKSLEEIFAMLDYDPDPLIMDVLKELLILKTKAQLLSNEVVIIKTRLGSLASQKPTGETGLKTYLNSLLFAIQSNQPPKLLDQCLNFFALPRQPRPTGLPEGIEEEMTYRKFLISSKEIA